MLNEGYDSIEKIKAKLKEQALCLSHNQDDKIYQKYFKQEIEIPVIAVINNRHEENFNVTLFIQNLLVEFFKKDYNGICLSEHSITNLLQKTLNLTDFLYTPMEKFKFYTHYCNVDYVVVEGSQIFLFENFEIKDFDMILHHSKLNNFKEIEEIPAIAFSESKDLTEIFNQVYCCLSME